MRRRIIAAGLAAAGVVPLLLASAFVFGCCVLPFHETMHTMAPVCAMATHGAAQDHDAQTPAQEKQEPVRRLATSLPQALRFAVVTNALMSIAPRAETAYRSFITLGAVRCDRDVGLHVLVDTFRI